MGSIDVISASAGTGKTYTLAERVFEAVKSGEVRPESLVAVTYTEKAAAELRGRLRRRLLEAGEPESAARLRDGYIGTVHSVSRRLLAEFCFDAGLPVEQLVAPEEMVTHLFRTALDATNAEGRSGLDVAARPFGLGWTRASERARRSPGSGSTWREVLLSVSRIAQGNRMDRAALEASARSSIDSLERLLDPVLADPDGWDAELSNLITDVHAAVLASMEAARDGGKQPSGVDLKRREAAERWLAAARSDAAKLEWSELARPWKQKGEWQVRALQHVTVPLREHISDHLCHPRLRQQLHRIVALLFGSAADVVEGYEVQKRALGVATFDDLLLRVADLLRRDDTRAALDGRIKLLLVDEFQDTSPLQLDVILGLSGVAQRSLWVGDRKQSIFGFQGADAELMEQARVAVAGESLEALDRNFRSRPALVGFASELFARVFEQDGIPREHVAVASACPEPEALAGHPGLHAWRLQPSAPDPVDAAGAIARGVREWLDRRVLVRVRAADPTAVAKTRPAKAGDFAVLARTNKECRAIAAALEGVGLSARVARTGLGGTRAAQLASAALAVVTDPRNRLAAAEVEFMLGAYANGDGAWLWERLQRTRAEDPRVAALRSLAEAAVRFGPIEALDAALDAIDLPSIVLGWPDPQRGLANIEALRGAARSWVEMQRSQRRPATLAGLVRHLGDLPDDTTEGAIGTSDAVSVLTWHRAKGLEWPVVIVTSLDSEPSANPWGPTVQRAERFDPLRPLAGRGIRWWPNPYGRQEQDMPLTARVHDAPESRHAVRGHQAEARRLLYVATTRARDHLVFAAAINRGAPQVKGLAAATSVGGSPLLELPWQAESGVIAEVRVEGCDSRWACRVEDYAATPQPATAATTGHVFWFAREAQVAREPLALRPSSATRAGNISFTPGIAAPLGARTKVQVDATRYADVGDAVHGFFAADPGPGASSATRMALAQCQLSGCGVDEVLAPASLVELGDRLWSWLKAFGGDVKTARREVPVSHLRADGRLVRGEVDLLMPHPEGGWLLVDHKTFAGRTDELAERVAEHGPQLAAYAEAIEAATGEPVRSRWLHFPLLGECVEVVANG